MCPLLVSSRGRSISNRHGRLCRRRLAQTFADQEVAHEYQHPGSGRTKVANHASCITPGTRSYHLRFCQNSGLGVRKAFDPAFPAPVLRFEMERFLVAFTAEIGVEP